MINQDEKTTAKSPAKFDVGSLIVGIAGLSLGALHGGELRESLIVGGGILTMIGGINCASRLVEWKHRRKDS